MKKNIRKQFVENQQVIFNGLEEHVKQSFVDTCHKIDNPRLVAKFWNKLVAYSQLAKDDEAKDLLASAVVTFGASQVLMANGNYLASTLANIATIGLAGYAMVDDHFSGKPAGEVQDELEAMLIAEPELYDIELAFNGYTREDIDTSEYDGKARYQKLNALYNEELKKTKLQHDLESDEDKAM